MRHIGLFSPNQNPYSETFVQAHKQGLKDKVYYYYGSGFGTKLEGHPPIASSFKKYKLKLLAKLLNKPLSFVKQTLIKDSLKKHQISVVLVEYGIHAHAILPIIKMAKLPMVVHFHGFDASVPEAIERCNHYKEVFEYASSVIVVSTVMKQMLIELGCPAEKIIYTPCGPRPEFGAVRPLFSTKQFIAIGRFVDKKAPYYTLLAFKRVVDKYPNAKLKMAGDGPLINTCENLVRHLKLESNVQFLGVISSEDFKTHLSQSIAFVQHSVRASNGDMEGTPVSVMEAGLAGLPVISTNHAGIPDVILHNETGLLSEEHDVERMGEYMLQLLDNPTLAKKLGDNNRKRIKDHFSLDKHIGLVQKAIDEAMLMKSP
ncbi:glycosyltransferase [Aureisphaera sp. CAU 1614]|uniref:Glycosyltransferase n=1 Tax=Halomarinibacterium sedimenti TaxID=2857106 RepID=A0A9X1FNF2_9FLAO|nr:glycosyltransferase [Halomarinibacterium sedimenti]MBW2937719.1 glycosyltransferase [Halomarinibacterium sedimenti]